MTDEKIVKLFEKHRIFTETEVHSRYEIKMEGYCKVIGIEALTMLELTRKQILPAVSAYAKELSETVIAKKTACPAASCEMEEALIEKLSSLGASLFGKANTLDEALLGAKDFEEIGCCAAYYHDTVFAAMQELRAVADELELNTAESYWPFPTYGDLLFSI